MVLAAAVLLLVPAAVLSIHGTLAPGQSRDDATEVTVYVPHHDDHSVPHGVDVGKRSALAEYLDEDDFIGNYEQASAESRAVADPHGKYMCASGCAANMHPTQPLLRDEFHRLAGLYATETINDSQALEHLLYYNRQTLLFLDKEGSPALDSEREVFLRYHLGRRRVMVEMRVVDEHGVVRTWNTASPVPMDIRHHFVMQTKDIQPFDPSGTVKRVGLYHLWQRI
jgi:hypothetical protein